MNEENTNIVYGRNSVSEALKSTRSVDKMYIQKGERSGSMSVLLAMAKEKHIPVIETDKAKLSQMCGTDHHQGVAALITDFVYSELSDILAVAEERKEAPFILILDGVTDPHNLGAILRTAVCCGVHGVILPKRNSCALTSTVYKTAAGACEYIKIARVVNIAETVDRLKEQNIWIYAADGGSDKATDAYETDMTGGIALVLGDEGKGISRLTLDRSDFHVKIPMLGPINSLNVSVAGGVLMYEILRQRRQKERV